MLQYVSEDSNEGIGDYMARLRIELTRGVPDIVIEFGDSAVSMNKPMIAELDSGTEVF